MAEHGILLCVHGEVTDPDIDIFDRERVFVATKLPQLLESAPGLKVVLEHLTTKEAAQAILDAGPNVAGTITPHHLLVNRNALLAGGIRPHYYCLPILKTEGDRLALIDAIRTGCNRLFLGTDSAPHAKENKECACGSAGVYSAHAALELYAEAFEKAGMLPLLEAFSSVNGPAFYGLPPNSERITLEQVDWKVPASIPFGEDVVVPFMAGTNARWKLQLWIVLHGAALHGAALHGAALHGAALHGAALHGAALHGADLHGADLHGADLHGAALHGAAMRADNGGRVQHYTPHIRRLITARWITGCNLAATSSGDYNP
eukprot:CAMPEP_0181197260 /NCGR_PEP_ID=MMETSP1096-20121128/15938_1 /TAXON_ID=156174 ORGANISM="Chrysochromulina ericina, Strain CCMP281" /NCGR_SAMPLE_ID=MMETSP1096 /ASSEMBLY_ACC=CAM_ASM_000453 /LENGTH=317 /DNA_ID=CAMNT_0023287143 /DNA_START=104 /DNA_END=1058 /DNA_ORIENTATION=+